MMSFRQWLVLLALYIIFMLLGSVVFLSLEVGHELAQRNETFALKLQAIEVLADLENESRAEVEALLVAVGQECDHDFLRLTQDEPPTWTLWNSFFFTFTVITTIGFGHMSPATDWGRIFCIIYAFFGVPLNGILVASLADLLSCKIINSQVRRRAKRYESRVGVALDAVLYLVPGLIIFLLLPATVLMAVEVDWNFLDSFYFAFITLTTIGFGDYVGGLQEHDHVLLWLYKIVMVIWIIFGLGYIVMIITFVQQALKSKKVHNLERKLASLLKRHASRLSTNVNRDLKRIRTMVNTLAVMQRQPMYLEDKREDSIAQKVVRKVKKRSGNEPSIQVARPSSPDVVHFIHHTPTTSRHTRHPHIPRSASAPDLTCLRKVDALQQLQSLSNINMFLDMVESLMLEHEALAAGDVEDEVRHIVEEVEAASESDFESDKKSEGSHSTEVISRDLENGYINQGYIPNDEEASAGHHKEPHSRDHHQREDDTKRYERLKNKLNVLLRRRSSQVTSLTDTPDSVDDELKAPNHLLGEVAAIFSQPPWWQPGTLGPRPHRRISRSVPARIKETSDKSHYVISDIFVQLGYVNSSCKLQQANGLASQDQPQSEVGNSTCYTDVKDGIHETQQTFSERCHPTERPLSPWLPPAQPESEEVRPNWENHPEAEHTRL